MHRSCRYVIGSTAATTTLLGLTAAWFTWPAVHARYLLHELQTLEIGRSTFDDASRLATRIDATVTPFAPCTRDSCEWEKRIDNHTLPRWWRGPGVGFVVSFNVQDGIVNRTNIGYGIGQIADGSYPSSVGLTQEEQRPNAYPRPRITAGWFGGDRIPFFEYRVSVIPPASPQELRTYTAYNYTCFWKYKGCHDGRDLLPIAAQDER